MRFYTYPKNINSKPGRTHKITVNAISLQDSIPPFWDKDAEYQNRIIIHDNTLNLPVVARQSHPDPNYAPHTAARRVVGA